MPSSPARLLRRCTDIALLVLLAAVGSGAACGDDKPDSSQSSVMTALSDSGSASLGSVDPSVERAVLAYQVDTPITEKGFERWESASADLARLPDNGTAFVRRVDGASPAGASSRANPIDAAVLRLDADPAAREAIERHGLTPRDYVLTTIALYQAQIATERAPVLGAYQPPAANVAFVRAKPEAARAARAYWEDDTRMTNGPTTSDDRRSDRDASAVVRDERVRDDRDSDGESDGKKGRKHKNGKGKRDKGKSDG